jgi:MYXO-CTERM domain-containing protein
MSRSSKRSEICLTTLAAAIAAASSPAVAQTFTVSNKNASGPGSFLYAVQAANEAGTADDIAFTISGSLALGQPLPTIIGTLDINGPGSGGLTIDASSLSSESPLLASGGSLSVSGLSIQNSTYGAFEISGEGTLELDDVRITGTSSVRPLVRAAAASTTVTISNSVFKDNELDDDSVILVTNSANLTVTNTIISGNTSTLSPALSVVDSTAYLNGVTMENNTNTGYGSGGSGALYVLDSSVEIVNSQLSGNSANNQYEGSAAGGGAILLRSATTASLSITGSTLSKNSSGGGGAIKMTGDPSLEISDSILSDNETRGFSDSDGGALSVGYEGTVDISNSTFSGNFAYDDGGAINSGYAAISITNSLFSANQAFDDGGAIRTSGSLSISGSSFIKNRSDDAGKPDDESSNRGGAIYTFGEGGTDISDSVFRDNVAMSDGGALSVSGANLLLENTLVDGNRAEELGGGLSIRGYGYGTVEFTGVTVSGNAAPRAAALIANLQNGQDMQVTGSTIADNSASDGPALEFNFEEFVDVNIDRSTISGNRAGGTASALEFDSERFAYGGNELESAFYSVLSISNSTISGNRSSDAAAAIAVRDVESGFIYSSTVVDNNGAGSGSTQFHLAAAQYYNGDNLTSEAPNFTIANSIFSSSNSTEVFVGGDSLSLDGVGSTSVDSLEPTLTIGDSNLERGFDSTEGATVSPASVINVDPELGPLADNGGATLTHAPTSALAPGIDVGEGGRPGGTDQRGVPDQGTTDQGAVEYTANRPPQLDVNLLSKLAGNEGKTVETLVVADLFVDPDGNAVSTVSVDGLPAGLTWSPIPDTVSGTLEQAGEYFVTVTVIDDGSPALETTVQGRVVVKKDNDAVFIDDSSSGLLGGMWLSLLAALGLRRRRRR